MMMNGKRKLCTYCIIVRDVFYIRSGEHGQVKSMDRRQGRALDGSSVREFGRHSETSRRLEIAR